MKTKPIRYTSDEELNQFYHDCHLLFFDLVNASGRLDALKERAKQWSEQPAVAFQINNLHRVAGEVCK